MKRWEPLGPISGNEGRRRLQHGQALVELSIFGGILLMLLGVLVSSGLNADFNQSATMDAFRRALKATQDSGKSGPVANSFVVVQDRHIPSPNHPLALGSVIPFTGSANVTRNYHMQDSPTADSALPRITYVMQGLEYSFTTSGFRRETIADDPNLLEKYRLVYGGGNVCSNKTCLGKFNPPIPEYSSSCSQYMTDPATGEFILDVETGQPICVAMVGGKNIMVIDPCEGQIINYDACVRQARMIVDPAACTDECNKAGNVSSQTSNNANQRCTEACKNAPQDQHNQCINECVGNITRNADAISADCQTTCNAGGMVVPWYATPYTPADPVVKFPTLAGLLPAVGTQMGLQSSMTQRTTKNNTLTKQETPAGITSTMAGTMSTTTTRTVRKVEGHQGIDQPIDSVKDVQTDATWQVSW